MACSEDDREGVYSGEPVELSGDCGPLGSVLVRWLSMTPDQCVIEMEAWHDDGCRQEAIVLCDHIGGDGPYQERWTSDLEQQDERGEQFVGTLRRHVFDEIGSVCESTYEVALERL